MKNFLERLYAREPLDRNTAYRTLLRIGNGEASEPEIAAVVSSINMRPATLTEVQGFRDAMLELAVPLDLERRETLDIVGTGGDGKNTFNISTVSACAVAGAGVPVTKHGSYGVSSSVGSSDVLLALGYKFTNDRDTLLRTLDRAGICFLHAPLFHPAMKAVIPVRRALRVRTFFNWLGPLINPARPKYQLLGTFSEEAARVYDYIFQEETEREYRIVHALDGYDEVSLTGPASVRSRTRQLRLLPEDFGLPRLQQRDLHGGETAEEGRDIFLAILENRATEAQTAAVCANTALALQTVWPGKTLVDCVAAARESLASGKAREVLRQLVGG